MSSGCVLRLAITRKRGKIGEVLRYGECSTATKCFLQVFWEDEIIPSKVKRLQIFWGTPSPLIFYYWSGSGYARAETYYSLTRLKAIGVGVGRSGRKTTAERSPRKESGRGAPGFRELPRRLFTVIPPREVRRLPKLCLKKSNSEAFLRFFLGPKCFSHESLLLRTHLKCGPAIYSAA